MIHWFIEHTVADENSQAKNTLEMACSNSHAGQVRNATVLTLTRPLPSQHSVEKASANAAHPSVSISGFKQCVSLVTVTLV